MSKVLQQKKLHDFKEELITDVNKIYDELDGKFDHSLIAEQIYLEVEGYRMGETEFYRRLEHNVERKSLEFSGIVSRPIKEWYGVAKDALENIIESQYGRPGRKLVWVELVKNIPTEVYLKPVIPAIISELVCTEWVNATQLYVRIGRIVEDCIRFYPLVTTLRDEWEKRYAKAHAERSSSLNRREYVKKVEAELVVEGKMSDWTPWEANELVQIGHVLLSVIDKVTGAFVIENIYNDNGPNAKKFNYNRKIKLKDEWVDEIVEEGYHLAGLRPYILPSVIPPRPWVAFDVGGTWTRGSKEIKAVKFIHNSKYKNINKRLSACDFSRVYEAVNIIQNTSFKINSWILDVIQDVADNDNLGKVLIDNGHSWVVKETPYQKLRSDFKEIENPTPYQIRTYKVQARDAKAYERPHISKRRVIDKTIEFAKMYEPYAAFYIPHRPDFRSRIYPLVNIELHQQRSDVSKAMLYCAEKKPMGERGWYWLKVCCASLGELDNTKNAHPDVRAQWVEDNLHMIMQAAHDPIGTIRWWAEADAPFQFLACCKEIADVIEYGDPCSFESGFPINLDGSCSGIQHFSAMLRDEVGGKEVNLIPMDTKQDLYGTVAKAVSLSLLKDKKELNGSDVEKDYSNGMPQPKKWQLAGYWLDYGVNRSLIKQNVMTYAYSSTVEGMKGQLLKVVNDKFGPESPEAIDPIDKHRFIACRYLAEKSYEETSKSVGKAAECMTWLQAIVTALAKENKHLEYTTLDGFPVFQELFKQTKARVNLPDLIWDSGVLKVEPKAFNPAIKIQSNKIDTLKQKSSVSPNAIHSIDATHLRMTVKACFEKGVKSFIMIHDSFGTIPADTQIMYDTVREQFIKLHEDYDLLEQIDMYAKANLDADTYASLPPKPTKGNLDLEGIKHSVFAFL